MKITTFNAHDHPTIEDVEKLLQENLGAKYEYKLKKKSASLAGKIMNGSAGDAITIIKDAYHRTVVTITTFEDSGTASGKRTSLYFSEDELAGWLGFLNKQTGLIGHLVIRAIYGSGDGFYEEVEQAIKKNLKGEDETHSVGLGALFGKKKG